MNARPFVTVPQVPETGFFFSQYFFLLFSDWTISIVLSPNSLILYSGISILLLCPSYEFFKPWKLYFWF